MSFDKEKIRRQAEKNLTHGKIQAAIKDYCQIADHDQKDYNTLNTLGDLYVRVNQKEAAISCFKRIAEHYDVQGFTHKAIAMYKKILRLLPNSIEISAKLAPLYQTLGLIAEARTFYTAVADDFQKKNEQLKALEVWSRIADLDPNDTQTRLKLAESYRREKQADKAAEAFAEAGSRLLAKKQAEQALYAFNQSLELAPIELGALSGFAEASIALGFPDEAAEKLERALEALPDNNEILSLLATVYVEVGNVEQAEKFVSRFVEREPASFARHLEVVKLYLSDGNVAEAARILGFAGEMFISNNQEDDLLGWLDEVLARDPEQLTALRLLARVRAWQRNEDELKSALERLAESAQLNGDETEERNALVELVTLFPEDNRYAARLRELNGEPEPSQIETDAQQPQHEIVPTFESFNSFDGEAPSVYANDALASDQNYATETWQSFAHDFADAYPAQTTENKDSNAYQFEFESSGSPNNFDFADGGAQTEVYDATNKNAADAFGNVASFDGGATFSFDAAEAQTVDSFDQSAAQTAAFDNAKSEAHLLSELEGVDFYIAQNLNDIALESLASLAAQFGAHPEIEKRRRQLNPANAEQNFVEQVAVDSFESASVETGFANQQFDEAASVATFVEKPPVAQTPIVSAPAVTAAASGFEDLFDEIGEDLEAAEISGAQTADYETHYNLGLAYKDMGLLDDAVEEFQNAVRMVAPNDGTPRYLQCCHLIGHCFMEKDLPKLAVIWFQRGVDAPGHSDDEYQALRYELGTAYERAGEKARALELFSDIYAVNVAYRSVSEKMRELQAA